MLMNIIYASALHLFMRQNQSKCDSNTTYKNGMLEYVIVEERT